MNTKKQVRFQICVSVPLIMNNMNFMLFQLLQLQRPFLLCQNNRAFHGETATGGAMQKKCS